MFIKVTYYQGMVTPPLIYDKQCFVIQICQKFETKINHMTTLAKGSPRHCIKINYIMSVFIYICRKTFIKKKKKYIYIYIYICRSQDTSNLVGSISHGARPQLTKNLIFYFLSNRCSRLFDQKRKKLTVKMRRGKQFD